MHTLNSPLLKINSSLGSGTYEKFRKIRCVLAFECGFVYHSFDAFDAMLMNECDYTQQQRRRLRRLYSSTLRGIRLVIFYYLDEDEYRINANMIIINILLKEVFPNGPFPFECNEPHRCEINNLFLSAIGS